MGITEYNSKKIKALSFLSILLVLYIHAVYTEGNSHPVANYIQGFFAFSGLSFVANPLFYTISGYLFYAGTTTASQCFPKIRKRFVTLVIPYILWNLIFIMWYAVLKITPGVSSFVNSNIIDDILGSSFPHALRVFFVKPIAFHLWFLRDLIIYVLLSPIIFIALQKIKWAAPMLLFILGTLTLAYLPPTIKVWGCFYFVLGGYLASIKILERNVEVPMSLTLICGLTYFANATLRPLGFIPEKWFDMFFEICGLVAIWGIYDLFIKKINDNTVLFMCDMGGYSFFIYLFHEPAFNIIKKLGLRILGCHEWTLILLYLVNPIIMCTICIIVAKTLKRVSPKTYSTCVGHRIK